MSLPATSAAAPEAGPGQVRNLATAFQEVLTAILRVRYRGLPVASADDFRTRIRSALNQAMLDGRDMGYEDDLIRDAAFAVVAFVDESVFSSRRAEFSTWQALQVEIFHAAQVAGVVFYERLDSLMRRSDSAQCADTIEVFVLCLSLGYQGQIGSSGYGAGSGLGDLASVIGSARRKIQRIRGGDTSLSPRWQLPSRAPAARRFDTVLKHLLFAAGACLALALGLFAIYKIALASTLSGVGMVLLLGGN